MPTMVEEEYAALLCSVSGQEEEPVATGRMLLERSALVDAARERRSRAKLEKQIVIVDDALISSRRVVCIPCDRRPAKCGVLSQAGARP